MKKYTSQGASVSSYRLIILSSGFMPDSFLPEGTVINPIVPLVAI